MQLSFDTIILRYLHIINVKLEHFAFLEPAMPDDQIEDSVGCVLFCH